MDKKALLAIAAALTIAAVALVLGIKKSNDVPIVAIVSYGPIPPMEASIVGVKKQLTDQGFIEGQTVRYEIKDICFDHTLIPQMVASLKNSKPAVMVLMATPIAQFAKGKIDDIPLVYNVITDPVDAGLIKDRNKSDGNVTGSSDMQDLGALLTFAQTILPQAKTVGLLYMTSDSNDLTLVSMMRSAAASVGMSVIAIPVDQVRDIPIRMQELKGTADLIYVGASGLQSALPIIASESQKMNIPMFNMEEQAVRDGLALASFGVNYESVGKNAGKLVAELLNGADIKNVAPVYPSLHDHQCFVNKKLAEKFGIKIPKNVTIVE
ncbi:ABC transporter substrate-binding protein [Alphaproteobacteria bacterium]|nr:ABC transporter substrate-binding protein [Alphaproteobacteria bacterium]